MEIELQTTKKKITKSIINQMSIASLFELKNGVPFWWDCYSKILKQTNNQIYV